MKIPFMTIELRSYVEVNPGGTDYRVDAIHILDSPTGKDTEFVLLETSLTMAHPPHYLAHFYGSEEQLFAVFWKGLESIRNPPPEIDEKTMKEVVDNLLNTTTFFANHPGFVRTIVTDDFGKAPWFLAEDGDTVEGDIAITPERV